MPGKFELDITLCEFQEPKRQWLTLDTTTIYTYSLLHLFRELNSYELGQSVLPSFYSP